MNRAYTINDAIDSYAHADFDFEADRERVIDSVMAICDLEERLRANGYFDTQSPNYGKPLRRAEQGEGGEG